MRTNTVTSACLAGLIALLAGCSNSGSSTTADGQPAGDPGIPVAVPDGAGGVQIDMAGTWVIAAAEVIETNAPTPNPPFNGTVFQFEPDRIATIGGLSVDPDDLALILGGPLASYVNVIDASRVFYGLTVDNRPTGGSRLESALAGGAISNNAILVEAYNSEQLANQPLPYYTRSRYVLLRVPGTTPLLHRPEDWTAEDLLRNAFGGF
jgi:hypothetical protein